MLWLVGFGEENTFAYTVGKLRERACEFSILDLDRIARAETLKHKCDGSSLLVDWGELRCEIARGDTVFQRTYFRNLRDSGRNKYLLSFLEVFSALCEDDSIVAINPPSSAIENGLKLLHLWRLAQVGFIVPSTLAANDAEWLAGVVQPDGNWISKGCSGVRTRVERISKEDYGQLASVRNLPVQFQERVGDDDVRIHCIGRRAIAVRIKSNADDYRYAAQTGHEVTMTRCNVPDAVLIRCFEYMNRTRLRFAGFDFRVAGDVWTVLECNPMPGYEYYDRKCEGAISAALCDEMCRSSQESAAARDGTIELDSDLQRRLFLTSQRRPRTQHS